ncbi:MAG: YqgE/AlgH family protein [Planctomycetia bacterium]|nr:YqgE/AlgH family protein [Planctomycetia bacterium]
MTATAEGAPTLFSFAEPLTYKGRAEANQGATQPGLLGSHGRCREVNGSPPDARPSTLTIQQYEPAQLTQLDRASGHAAEGTAAMTSLQGSLLVASPALLDPNFRKTVVLIVRHSDEDGAVGLVLNRRTSATIKELWERVRQEECGNETPLSLGGPCEGPLMALHTESALGDMEVLPGVYFTADGHQLKQLVSEPRDDVRFFFGYAGWGAGQLEMELEGGAWRTEPAAIKHVFGSDQGLWDRSMTEAAGWEVLAALKIKDLPSDPSMN